MSRDKDEILSELLRLETFLESEDAHLADPVILSRLRMKQKTLFTELGEEVYRKRTGRVRISSKGISGHCGHYPWDPKTGLCDACSLLIEEALRDYKKEKS